MRLIVIESPYAGDVAGNRRYLAAAMRDVLARGEAPFASHGLYTAQGVLDDLKPAERRQGIAAGLAWAARADASAFYIDRGFSAGMAEGLAHAISHGRNVEFRSILFGDVPFDDARAIIADPPLRTPDAVMRYLRFTI